MKVILKLGPNSDRPKVEIEANVVFTTVTGFDKWLKAQKVARDWLAKEKGIK